MQSNNSVEQHLPGEQAFPTENRFVDMPDTFIKLRHRRASYLLERMHQALTSTPLQRGHRRRAIA